MKSPVKTIEQPADVEELSRRWGPEAGDNGKGKVALPEVLSVADLMALDVPVPEMLIEGMIPMRGASLIVGAPKSGKPLLAAQTAIAVASGAALFRNYRVNQPGPVLLVEQDDPAATASVKEILSQSAVPVAGIPSYLVPKVPYQFGPELIDWLGGEIASSSLRMAVLDSYTALRGARVKGGDFVKAEQEDLSQLDALAKRTGSAVLILHHASKGSAGLDWSQQAAGSFAMSAATESQIFISRYPEFRKQSLDYEHVLDGGAASAYPLILQLQNAFGKEPFGAKELTHETGVSRATAHRQIERLYRTGALTKRGYGEYVLAR